MEAGDEASDVFREIFSVFCGRDRVGDADLDAVFFEYFGGQIRNLMLVNNRNMIEIIGDQVGRNFREIASYGEVLSFEDNVQDSLKGIYQAEDSFSYYANVQKVNRMLRTYVYLNSNSIYDILLTDSEGTALDMDDTYQTIFEESGDPILRRSRRLALGNRCPFLITSTLGSGRRGRDSEEEPESGSHIGLRNTNKRLKLIYGPEAGLNIDSEAGAGTVVWFAYEK